MSVNAFNDDDRDENTGQARSGRQSAVGETPGELMDVRPNLACSSRWRDGRVRASVDA
jgi:hypothetical protein